MCRFHCDRQLQEPSCRGGKARTSGCFPFSDQLDDPLDMFWENSHAPAQKCLKYRLRQRDFPENTSYFRKRKKGQPCYKCVVPETFPRKDALLLSRL